ncbi:carbohydrate ABC transporter permease [Candidatus Epulonipiscium viviparus]|uniref:carbohydrate ABC transporter permease n=1 Tax=Candidatus Epulonipiscium viviparus TaxID=420336 RepID=UPI00273807F6|nr:sugar ABC transporter permease [Candidatus Epulopiscium viviparus]
MKKIFRQETIIGYLFILPTLLGFIVFMGYPLIYSIFLSFWDWNMMQGVSGSEFVGLNNYIEVFQDSYFIAGLSNNLKMLFVAVPILLTLALTLACILNTAIFGRGIIRTIYFMPYITTVTAAAIVFAALFHDEFGPINEFLRIIGIENPPGWLASVDWSMPTVGIFWIWRMLGYCIILFLAGLQGIPKSYYEAAAIDGATGFAQFRHITFPLISPTTFFLTITMGIASFSIFAETKVMTSGGPGTSSYTLVYMIYKDAFENYEMGYASAIGIIFFSIILIITLIQWFGQKHWVNY